MSLFNQMDLMSQMGGAFGGGARPAAPASPAARYFGAPGLATPPAPPSPPGQMGGFGGPPRHFGDMAGAMPGGQTLTEPAGNFGGFGGAMPGGQTLTEPSRNFGLPSAVPGGSIAFGQSYKTPMQERVAKQLQPKQPYQINQGLLSAGLDMMNGQPSMAAFAPYLGSILK